jgi:hypothetical protein
MQITAGDLLMGQTLEILTDQEFALRRTTVTQPAAIDLLATSVRVLELYLAAVMLNEALHELGVNTLVEVHAREEEIMRRASGIARLDLARVLRENAEHLASSRGWSHAHQHVGVEVAALVRSVRALLAFWPIDALETTGQAQGLAELAHRCRVAYDDLTSFVRRNDPAQDAAAKVIGRAYAEGRLSLPEAAAVLRLAPSDAVAFLETHGFCRSLETIALPGEERQSILARIRADRLKRDGKPAGTALVARSVVATQRIEGVDARPWVPR